LYKYLIFDFMNVSLTPTLENFVRETVATGLYNNASEVMREALRLLRAKEQKRKQLFDALDVGYKAFEEGRHSDVTAKEILNKVIAKRKQ